MAVTAPAQNLFTAQPEVSGWRQNLRIRVMKSRSCFKRMILGCFIGIFITLGIFAIITTLHVLKTSSQCGHYFASFICVVIINAVVQIAQSTFVIILFVKLPHHETCLFKKFKKVSYALFGITFTASLFYIVGVFYFNQCFKNWLHAITLLGIFANLGYHVFYFVGRSYTANYHITSVDRRIRNVSIEPVIYDAVFPYQRQTVKPPPLHIIETYHM